MKLIDKLFKTGALISLTAMITAVTIQVFTRLFMDSTPHWTEEAARIFFIYSVAFGTGTGLRNGDFVRLDLIGRSMSRKTGRILDVVTDIIVIIFSTVLLVHSLKFVKLGMDELSPALEITMGFVFISIAIIGLAIAIFTVANLQQTFKEKP
jgi:TRAP-type transport system small permease protein